jgi:hypothetical protein
MKDTKALHVHFQEEKEKEAKPVYDGSISLSQSIEQFVAKKKAELERKADSALAEIKTVTEEVKPSVEQEKQDLPPARVIYTTTHLSDKDMDIQKPKRKRKRARKNKEPLIEPTIVAVVEAPVAVFSVLRLPSVGDHIGYSKLGLMEDCTPGEIYQV